MPIQITTRREVNRLNAIALGAALAALVAGRAAAGPAPRIAHTLHGTVVAVDSAAGSLTVQARRLEAWMGAITSIYAVNNEKLLRRVRAGDQIMGKVFDGEAILRQVEIVAVSARAAAQA
jgi:Cu/Ag efflux protein CusF